MTPYGEKEKDIIERSGETLGQKLVALAENVLEHVKASPSGLTLPATEATILYDHSISMFTLYYGNIPDYVREAAKSAFAKMALHQLK